MTPPTVSEVGRDPGGDRRGAAAAAFAGCPGRQNRLICMRLPMQTEQEPAVRIRHARTEEDLTQRPRLR